MEEMYRASYGGVRFGVSMPSPGAPASQYLDVFTSLEGLWIPLFKSFYSPISRSPLPSLQVRNGVKDGAENSHPLITYLVILVTSSHPETVGVLPWVTSLV